jgi:hypothetical protein
MEQIAQKTKRSQPNPAITKTYTVKASKSQQKSKTAEQNTTSPKLAESKPFVPSKADTHAQSHQKPKKYNENQCIQAKNSTSPTYSNTKYSKSQKNKNETYSQMIPAKHNNNSQSNKRNYSTGSTQPSENDSESFGKKQYEGFKVVQNGNIILDSLLSDSETESQNEEISSGSEVSASKVICFATSQCNIGPSSNKISLPEFLMGY